VADARSRRSASPCLLTLLREGQAASVLQLPAQPKTEAEAASPTPSIPESPSNTTTPGKPANANTTPPQVTPTVPPTKLHELTKPEPLPDWVSGKTLKKCPFSLTYGGRELPPKVVQHLLGHSSIVMTLDVYGHLFPHGNDRTELAFAGTAACLPTGLSWKSDTINHQTAIFRQEREGGRTS
jgi:hypothetical protein